MDKIVQEFVDYVKHQQSLHVEFDLGKLLLLKLIEFKQKACSIICLEEKGIHINFDVEHGDILNPHDGYDTDGVKLEICTNNGMSGVKFRCDKIGTKEDD